MPRRILLRLRAIIRGTGDKNAARIRRRRALAAFSWRTLPKLKLLLFVVGYVWMLTLPSSLHGQRTYIDENALQPGQVSTYWNWGEVHKADRYLEQLESLRDRNASSHETAAYIATEFRKLGIPASTQEYAFRTSSKVVNGTNAYGVLSSPRASGTEAIVISAPRFSRTGEGDGTPNLRGIATVLSLAGFLKGYSLWAKDLVFVISDGYLDGMQAWITSYHGVEQSNLIAEPLHLSSGVIWTALNIDYPGHSFSHLGVFFEGLNGRLPNQDLINSFQIISRHTGGVLVRVYDHPDPQEDPGKILELVPNWLPEPLRQASATKDYAYKAQNILRHVGYQARGRASGVHGLLHQFRIDAITLFAVPATGPHGFHAIGRVVESTLRTMNNLLERLHASYFFYLLVGTTTFMKIGTFLPSAVLVSTAMLFGGLGEWVDARWVETLDTSDAKEEKDGESPKSTKWVTRRRPVIPALSIVVFTHALGALLFYLLTRPLIVEYQRIAAPILSISALLVAYAISRIPRMQSPEEAPHSKVLKSFNLCLASTVISITSVLNFSLAAVLAILVGVPLSLSGSSPSFRTRLSRFGCYAALAFGWIAFIVNEGRQALWNWEVLGVWFAPFVCIVYTPLVLQAGVVCLLS